MRREPLKEFFPDAYSFLVRDTPPRIKGGGSGFVGFFGFFLVRQGYPPSAEISRQINENFGYLRETPLYPDPLSPTGPYSKPHYLLVSSRHLDSKKIR